MPPRLQPKIHQIQLRTHKLSIFLTVPPSTTIASLKAEALSALTSDVVHPDEEDYELPTVNSEKDFEIVRAMKNKGTTTSTGMYETLDPSRDLRACGLAGWEVLFLQFRDPTTGTLMPVTYTLPSVLDEDDQMSVAYSEIPSETGSSGSKGKRKAVADPGDD